MSRKKIDSQCRARILGAPSLYTVQADLDPRDPTTWQEIVGGRNMICVGMYDAVQNLLLRNFENWQTTSVVVGFGGDYNQPEDPITTPPADQGVRQAPSYADAYVRKPLYRAAIVQTVPSDLAGERRLHYISIIRPDEALTDEGEPTRPFINEFGLEAYNETLLAHYVTPEDPDTGRAERFAKSNLEWWVIDWEIEFVGDIPAS